MLLVKCLVDKYLKFQINNFTMSIYIPNTRVAWGLVVVIKNNVRSLHLIKKNYRGKISYYSKSARGVPEKVGFGQVD